jgi:ankyrin repeat protein
MQQKRTPLHAAAELGSIPLVKLLLDNGASVALKDDVSSCNLAVGNHDVTICISMDLTVAISVTRTNPHPCPLCVT